MVFSPTSTLSMPRITRPCSSPEFYQVPALTDFNVIVPVYSLSRLAVTKRTRAAVAGEPGPTDHQRDVESMLAMVSRERAHAGGLQWADLRTVGAG